MKLSPRDKKAWALGFRAAYKLLGERVGSAFVLDKEPITAILAGERSRTQAPDHWPEAPRVVDRRQEGSGR